tara:strand:+ start:79 stop:762 length:684 start_codon:yes stop_codon:yes gene_type:complete
MFSIVIPLFNEDKNITPLIDEIADSISIYNNYEIILINDASTDKTLNTIKKIKNSSVKVINNLINKGQSYSIHKGIEYSKNNIIITIDGDGQNDPNDIPKLLEIYISNSEIKLIGGIRKNRKDTTIKKISSKIANYIRSIILKDNCKDTGCSLKVFDKKIFLSFPYFDGIHRFLPALFKGYGYKTKFINVNHRTRKYGVSKYGTINRLFIGIRDILKVNRMLKNKKL